MTEQATVYLVEMREIEQMIEFPSDIPKDQPLRIELAVALPMPPRQPSPCADSSAFPDHYFPCATHGILLTPQQLQGASWPLKLIVRHASQPESKLSLG